ncbi:hypothetical protein D3C76_1549720 [compost metagenome]
MLPARRKQLLARPIEGMRLAKDLFAQHGNLVRANDQMIRVAVRECLGFLLSQASNQFDSRLVIQALLVYIGACPGKGQAQALEQFAPVRGAGSQ